MTGAGRATGGSAVVEIFDGAGKPWAGGDVLIRVRDGNQHLWSSDFHTGPQVEFTGLPLENNFADNYTFIASAAHHRDAGFYPVRLSPGMEPVVSLMLIPKESTFNFARASWPALDRNWPELKALAGIESEERYGRLQEDGAGSALACLLNIATAMRAIHLRQLTAFDYLKRLVWDEGRAPKGDRFFAWADARLVEEVVQAVHQPRPTFEPALKGLHPGATRSYKQIEFGEANVQLTFHENDPGEPGEVLVECDIDYFRDMGAHLLLEVAVNTFGEMTDPREVFVLRWIAGRRAGVPDFEPLYTIERTA